MTDMTTPSNPRALICLGSTEGDPVHLQFAAQMLDKLSMTPVLACVRTKGEAEAGCRARLEKAMALMKAEQLENAVLQGHPERAILRMLDRGRFQLLVLGASPCSHGSHEYVLKQRLADKAKTNVLVVQDPPEQIERILVCTGGQKISETAVLASLDIAQAWRSHLTILHIATAAPSMYAGLEAQDESLEQVLARQYPLSDHLHEMAALAEKQGVEAQLELRHGVVIEEILRACDMNPCDLIVVGAIPSGAFLSRLALGRVAPQLISSSDRSILVVRTPLQP